jgi:hypothetical protein
MRQTNGSHDNRFFRAEEIRSGASARLLQLLTLLSSP